MYDINERRGIYWSHDTAIRSNPRNNHSIPLLQSKDSSRYTKNGERPLAPEEEWRSAPAEIHPYRAGTVYDRDGKQLYKYPSGVNLVIKDEEVMSTCETAWCHAAVNLAFEELTRYGKRGPFVFFELGVGLGIIARIAINTMKHRTLYRGNRYDGVELNHDLAERARSYWSYQEEQERERRKRTDLPGIDPPVRTRIFEGEAARAVAKRRRLIAEGKDIQADIIMLDTYPIREEDRGKGKHDLQYLEDLKYCVADDGVVLFFPWFPDSPGGITPEQERLIKPHFGEYRCVTIPNQRFREPEYSINPPPSYNYLYRNGNPVRALPIGILKDPIR